VAKLKYLGKILTNQNCTDQEIKNRLDSQGACYYSVQNLSSSSLLPNNIKIKIHRTIILSVVLYGCDIWLLMFREESRLSVFENRVLRAMLGPKMDDFNVGHPIVQRSIM
jgi:hypothetical protein